MGYLKECSANLIRYSRHLETNRANILQNFYNLLKKTCVIHGLRFFRHTYVEEFSCRLKRYGHINRVDSSLASSNVGQLDATKATKTSTRTMQCD